MSLHQWALLLSSLEVVLAAVTLLFMVRSKAIGTYWPLLALVSNGIVPYFLLLWLRAYRLFSPRIAYDLYFYTFWSLYLIAAICSAIMTYTIFHEAFRPLKGLQTLGTVMYRWTGSLSIAVAIGAILLPSANMNQSLTFIIVQFLRASGIIVLGLILFVGFSIKPLGLEYRSRIFGIGSGIGIIAFSNTLQAGYIAGKSGMYSSLGLLETVFQCCAELIWVVYFYLPEPQRKFVLLPTTSPFHAWNQVSERLGHEPGYVAIGGIPPEAFAPAELDIFQRASLNYSGAEDNATRSKGQNAVQKIEPSAHEAGQPSKTSLAIERLLDAFRSDS